MYKLPDKDFACVIVVLKQRISPFTLRPSPLKYNDLELYV